MGDTSPPEETFLFTFFSNRSPRQSHERGSESIKNKDPGNKNPGEVKGINEGESNCRKEVLR